MTILMAGHYLSLVTRPLILGLQLASVLVLGTWLTICIVKPRARPRTPLLLPVFVAIAAYSASALFSQRPRLSLESTIGGLGFALAFVFATRLLTEAWFRARAATLLILLSTSISVLYIVQVFYYWIDWWMVIGRISIPPLRPTWAGLNFGSPNVVGTFLLLAGPLAVVLLRARTGSRVPALLLGTLVAIALFLTGSRGAYLGAVLGAVTVIALAATFRDLPSIKAMLAGSARRRRGVLVFGVAIGLAVLLPSVVYRFATGGDTVRFDLWKAALTIFAEHPVTGGGPGTWVQLKVAANPVGVPNNIFNNAHNMYVQAAAELGIVGIAALLLLVYAVGRRLLRATREDSLGPQAIAVLGGLVGLGAQLMVENMIRLPAICLLIVVVVAWVDAGLPSVAQIAGPRRVTSKGGPLSQALPVVGLAALVWVLPALARMDLAANESAYGDSWAMTGNWRAALDSYETAISTDPGFTLYEIDRASALARLGRTEEARTALGLAIDRDPVAINQIGLAVLNAELGDNQSATAWARSGLALGIGEPTVAINAGRVGEQTGDIELALDGFASAVAWSPALAGSPFWGQPERLTTKDAVVQAARTRVSELDAALIAAYAGQFDMARAELDRLPDTGTRAIYLAATAWLEGDPAAAIRLLDARLQRNPLDWTAAAWAAKIARLSGEEAEALRYTRWAIAVQGDTAPTTILEKTIIASGEPEAVYAGLPKGYPSAVYLRTNSPYLLMPQLVLVGTR
jgi:O-antigen ligase/tetratricopeptide (TPR) repeat protein